jgi:hypothetical protein
VCEISVVADPVNISGQTTANKFKTPDCRLSEDFGNLLENSSFSDVVLTCGTREFKAHKAILSGDFLHIIQCILGKGRHPIGLTQAVLVPANHLASQNRPSLNFYKPSCIPTDV